jgi:hypothetical protein
MKFKHITKWEKVQVEKMINTKSVLITNWNESSYWKNKFGNKNHLKQTYPDLIKLANILGISEELENIKYESETSKETIFELIRIFSSSK